MKKILSFVLSLIFIFLYCNANAQLLGGFRKQVEPIKQSETFDQDCSRIPKFKAELEKQRSLLTNEARMRKETELLNLINKCSSAEDSSGRLEFCGFLQNVEDQAWLTKWIFDERKEYSIITAKTLVEAQNHGCDIFVKVRPERGGNASADVISVYSRRPLMYESGKESWGRMAYTDIGTKIADAFAPGTSNYEKIIAERKEYHKRQQPQTTTSTGISKEELKNIVEAAVEKSQKKTEKAPPAVSSDIDNPAFDAAEKIMGDSDIAVIVGIEGYQNLPKSDYSYDDARLVKEYIKALGFKERNIELLTDERATKTNIEKSLEAWLKNKAKPQSRVFVYYSGHGAPDPSTGDAYLVPYDGDPNYLSITGYPLKRLYGSLGKLRVREVTVVLDACFSGAGGRSVLAKGARPLVMTTESLTLSSNMAVLSATQGSQISTSSPERGHGIFTYYFLKALKDGHKDLGEIYGYLKPLVEDDAKALNVQQSPSLNPAPEKLTGRFNLRR